jgi:hypothetical protein
MSYVADVAPPDLSPATTSAIRSAFSTFIDQYSAADPNWQNTPIWALLTTHLKSIDPLERVLAILAAGPDPLPPVRPSFHRCPLWKTRQPFRPWTVLEDQRLIAGIHRYGVDDWTRVAAFVGASRDRPQCSQRWLRGLDPRLSKRVWTPEEEKKLVDLVTNQPNMRWTEIAALMGNRSDSQCRYRIKQLYKAGVLPEVLTGVVRPRRVQKSKNVYVGRIQRAPAPKAIAGAEKKILISEDDDDLVWMSTETELHERLHGPQ